MATDAVLGAGTPVLAAAPTPARAGRRSLRLALVAAPPVGLDRPEGTADLRAVYAAIERDDPDAVLVCGNLTRHGHTDELAAYVTAIPRALRARIRPVPGTAEAGSDEPVRDTFRGLFPEAPHSIDIDGVHVTGLNATAPPRTSPLVGPRQLEWLRTDLAAAGRRPAVVFLHHPLGGDHTVVDDRDELSAVLAEYGVRAVVSTGSDEVTVRNGATHLSTVAAARTYYDLHRTTGPMVSGARSVDHLRVDRIRVDPGGRQVDRSTVARIPLTGPVVGGRIRPSWARVGSGGDGATVTLRLPPQTDATAATAFVAPTGGGPARPVALRLDDGVWSALVPVAALASGRHRMRIRTHGPSGTHDLVRPFDVPARSAVPVTRWSHRLPGSIEAGPTVVASEAAADAALVVAATTAGRLEAVDAGLERFQPRWQVSLGPMYRSPILTADGGSVIAGDADGRLTAVAVADGARVWQANLGAPVLGAPVLASVDGRELVVVAAGRILHVRDAVSGRPVWSTGITTLGIGAPVVDGTAVVLACLDGTVRAVDLRDGSILGSAAIAAASATVALRRADASGAGWRVDGHGLLTRTEPAGSGVTLRHQLGTATVVGAPARVGRLFVFGDRSGTLTGVELPK